jgi:lysine biosynthesis protein LysW
MGSPFDQGEYEKGDSRTVTTTRLETRASLCPLCDAEVRLMGRLLIGEVIGCGRCGAQLEVASLQPLSLEPFARVDEEEEDLQRG